MVVADLEGIVASCWYCYFEEQPTRIDRIVTTQKSQVIDTKCG